MANELNNMARINIEPDAHEGLKILAGHDRRTLGAEAAWLIAQELASRGCHPDTLEPKPPAEPSSTRDSETAPPQSVGKDHP